MASLILIDVGDSVLELSNGFLPARPWLIITTHCQHPDTLSVCHSPPLTVPLWVPVQATTPWLETAERLSAGDQGGGARRRVDEVKGGRRARILLEPLTSDLPLHTSTR